MKALLLIRISNYLNLRIIFRNVTAKEINRPCISNFLYEYLPLIDKHKKKRQHILNLERNWATKDFWFILLTTIVGMTVVDMHIWYRNLKTIGVY